MVIDTDGSAFITKAEFDSLKNNFQAQIDNYNTSIDSKIDGAIAAYLAGIKVSSTIVRPIYLSDKPKVLSIGTTNFPKYEYSECMFVSENGGLCHSGDDVGGKQDDRRQYATIIAWKMYGNPDQWNNPKQKKVAIRNVKSSTPVNGEYVDYYQACAEKIVLGVRPQFNIASGYLAGGYVDEPIKVKLYNQNGKVHGDSNWDLTQDPSLLFYGSLVDATSGKWKSYGSIWGNYYFASADTKWTNPIDCYINEYKQIPHRTWSNYEYNCSFAGTRYNSYLDDYAKAMRIQTATKSTADMDCTDPENVALNARWLNATYDGTHDNTIQTGSAQYYPAGGASRQAYGKNTFKLVGANLYNYSTMTDPETRMAGMFCLGWDYRVTDWSQLWFAPYDKLAEYYDTKTYTNKTNTLLTGKDGKKHLALIAGFPLLQVNKNETITYEFKIEESGQYDLFIRDLPFTNLTTPSSETCLTAKNLTTGAAASPKVILTGGATNKVEFTAPQDSYIWIKWAKHNANASNNDGLGTLVLSPSANVTLPES